MDNLRSIYGDLEKIGEGTYSNVYKTPKNIVIKTFKESRSLNFRHEIIKTNMFYSFDVHREIVFSKLFLHPNIIYCNKLNYKKNIGFFCEYDYIPQTLNDISLSHFVDINFIKELLFQMIGAIKHIHSNGIIHSDIKPHNILVEMKDNKFKFTLIDFNISQVLIQRENDFDYDILDYYDNKHNYVRRNPFKIKEKKETFSTENYSKKEARNITQDIYSLGSTILSLIFYKKSWYSDRIQYDEHFLLKEKKDIDRIDPKLFHILKLMLRHYFKRIYIDHIEKILELYNGNTYELYNYLDSLEKKILIKKNIIYYNNLQSNYFNHIIENNFDDYFFNHISHNSFDNLIEAKHFPIKDGATFILERSYFVSLLFDIFKNKVDDQDQTLLIDCIQLFVFLLINYPISLDEKQFFIMIKNKHLHNNYQKINEIMMIIILNTIRLNFHSIFDKKCRNKMIKMIKKIKAQN